MKNKLSMNWCYLIPLLFPFRLQFHFEVFVCRVVLALPVLHASLRVMLPLLLIYNVKGNSHQANVNANANFRFEITIWGNHKLLKNEIISCANLPEFERTSLECIHMVRFVRIFTTRVCG